MKPISRARLSAVAGLCSLLLAVAPSFADGRGDVIGGAATVGVSSLLLHRLHHKAKTASTDAAVATPKHHHRKTKSVAATATGTIAPSTP